MSNNNNKLLLVLLVGVVGAIAFFSLKLNGTASATGNSNISLSTNPDPLQFGPAHFIFEVKDKEGKTVDNATVSFDLNMMTMDMGAQQGNAISQGNGKYEASGRMTMRGPWRIKANIKMPDGSTDTKDFTVNVP